MISTAFILDVVASELKHHEGVVFGVSHGDCIVISSTCCLHAGLTPVATTRFDETGLPKLTVRDGAWSLRTPHGRKVPVTVLRWSSDFAARYQGLVDTPALARKTCAVVGVSSIGALLALYLARACVRLVLVDAEPVALENCIRSVFTVPHIGTPKVLAAADLAMAANPRAEVIPIQENWDPANDELNVLLDRADLIVNCASTGVGFGLADRYHRTKPMLFPALHANAASGEVFVSTGNVAPERACFTCYRGSVGAAIPSGRRWNYSSADHELEAEPGLGPDIGHVVSIAAALALGVLSGTPERVLFDDRQLLLLSNRKGALFEESYATRWIRVKRVPDCPNHEAPEVVDPSEYARLIAEIPRM